MSRVRKQILETIRKIDDALYAHARRKRILFVMSDGYGFSCQAPIIEALLRKDDVIVHTTTDKPRPLDNLPFSDLAEKRLFTQLYIPTRIAEFSKWHLVIDTHRNSFYPRRHTLRAYMHHGPGFGIHGSKVHIARDYDIFLGLSETERYFFERIDPDIFKDRTFIPIGFPKADSIVRQQDYGPAIHDRLGLPRRRKTILIASHWQTTSLLGSLGHEPFDILTSIFPNCNIVQTGHPWFWNRQDTNKEVFNRLTQIAASRHNAFFRPFVKAEDLLIAADVLVSDHSSIITSYCLLNRPIVWFDNPENSFAIREIETVYRCASYPFSRINEIYTIFSHSLNESHNTRKSRRITMKNIFYSHVGQSCARTAEAIYSILKKPPI